MKSLLYPNVPFWEPSSKALLALPSPLVYWTNSKRGAEPGAKADFLGIAWRASHMKGACAPYPVTVT